MDSLFQDSDSESDISLTSTVESEAQDEYLIDRILAERPRYNEYEDEDEDEDDDQQNVEYLVKWTGYSRLRSTWEPVENFTREHDTFVDWEDRKTKEQRGLEKPFDVAAWENDVADFAYRRERRRAKRALKRKQVAEGKRGTARHLLKRDSAAKTTRSRTTSENPTTKSRVGSVSDKATTSNESGSGVGSDDDLSSLLRQKRKPSRSPAHREKKRTLVSAGHTGVLAQRVQPSANTSPSLPDLPADVVEAEDNQTSFNSLFDSAQDVPPESNTLGLKILGAAQANAKPSTNEALALSKTANTETANESNLATSNIVNVLESVDKSSQPTSSGLGFSIKGAAVPVRPMSATTKIPPPSKKKSVGSVPTIVPPAGPSKPATKHAGMGKVSMEQALAQAKQAKQRADAEGSRSNLPAVAPSSLPAARINSGPKKAPPGPAPVKGPSVFAGWDKNKKRDVRRPVSATDPTLFKSLSVQHNIQKWTNCERAPDINALRMVNPKTGKVEPALRPSASTSGLRLDTDLGPQTGENARGPGSASVLETRSGHDQSAPPGLQVNANPAAPQQSYTTAPGSGPRSASLATNVPYGKKGITCPYWKKARCIYSDHDCLFAHSDTGRSLPKFPIVCEHWERRRCRFSADTCLYMHHRPDEINPPNEQTGQGSYFERQYGRREESPDVSGRRQDEIDRRNDGKRKNTRSSISNPTLVAPSSAVTDKGTASSPRRGSLIVSNSPLGRSSTVDTITSPPLISTDQDNFASPSVDDSAHLTDSIVAGTSAMELKPMEMLVNIQIMSQKNTTLQSRLVFDFHPSNKEFITIIGDNVELEARNICMASDFQKYCFEDNLAWTSGEVSSVEDQETQLRFTDYLQLNAAGAIVHGERFTMVIYPSTEDYWGFLGKHGKPSPSALRFHVQRVTPDVQTYSTSQEEILKPGMSALAAICEDELGLDKSRLFQGNNKKLEKLVFLMFPSHLTPEAQLITACLLEMGAIIYNGDVPGAWEKFRYDQKDQVEFGRSGVILFHPSMTQYGEIPHLSLVLFSGNYNLFQLGVDASLKDHPDAAVNYTVVRLFPTSGVLLITDDVFEFHPRSAVKVLKMFYEGISSKPEGARNDRIVTRPQVKEWLYDLIDKYAGKEDATDRVWLCHMVAKMLPDVDSYGNPLPGGEESFIISPRMEEHPGYSAMWDRDEESATDWLVEWYAGWCIEGRERFRRFTILHEQQSKAEQTPGVGIEKDPRQWGKKWNQIRVMNCRRWLEGGGKR